MTEAAVSFAGNLIDDPEVCYTHDGIARAMVGSGSYLVMDRPVRSQRRRVVAWP